MARIDDLISALSTHRHHDEKLWDLAARVSGRMLENMKDEALMFRLNHIERNIMFLDDALRSNCELSPEEGWLSPWYWRRLRYWTKAEMAQRGLQALPTEETPASLPVRREFLGVHGGDGRVLVRISRREWVLETLKFGRLRFAPATDYRTIEGDEARTDDEMSKGYRRPGRLVTITLPDGRKVNPIGDLAYSAQRVRGEVEIPYWLLCFSTMLDPRLMASFASDEGDDAVIVIWDVEALIRRGLPHLKAVAPLSEKRLIEINYYDAYYPLKDHPPLTVKDMRFTYQREIRFIIDPGDREVLGAGSAFSIEVGSIEDIAAVYAPNGNRIAGTGPETFLA